MDVTAFVDAVNELGQAKGLSREAIITALEEAIQRAYIRHLGGGDDAVVTCHIDEEKGDIYLAQIKKVVEEVEDDYLEISVEDANEGRKRNKFKVGDDFPIVCPVSELSKVTTLAVKNNFRQRLAEAERQSLYETYKNHIGEMLTGIVEKSEEHSVTIRIDRATIELTKRELIGDETFRYGEPIKVYIQEVKTAEPIDGKPARGPQIEATRSSEGFLKRLFEEEIHEIYDGTVIIKAIARQAGLRSKVAVYSANEDVDPTGACIGQGGSRIQRIVSQLGNGKNRENIDIIRWNENPGVFLIEAVRPAVALGLNLYPEEKKAEILIEDGTSSLAMGRYKANYNLACRLTGYKIEFVERTNADLKGMEFTPIEVWRAQAEEEKRQREREVLIRRQQEELARREEEARLKAEEEARLKAEAEAQAAKEAEEEMRAKIEAAQSIIPTPVVKPKASVDPSSFPSEAMNPAAAALASVKAAEEERKAREAAKADKAEKEEAAAEEEAVVSTEVKTTTTLSDLEKELESSKEKKAKAASKAKRPREISEEEVAHEPVKPVVPQMPVYTEEELNQMALEEEDVDYGPSDEEIEEEYAEYDDYYDDEK